MRNTYKAFMNFILFLSNKVHLSKTFISEWVGILRKYKLYKEVKLTRTEIKRIDNLWMKYYGKKISKRWHKLYQSINGKYNEFYFPDHIFSTKLEPKLNPVHLSKYYSDKGLTELIYSGVDGIKFPKTIIVNSSGYFYDEKRNVIEENKVIEIINKLDEFVIKPTIGGSSGNSVKIVNLEKIEKVEKLKKIKEILKIYKENYIIQLKVLPHFTFSKIYPHSINTVRLITYILDGHIYHAPLSFRMGNNNNTVDNIHAGGIVVSVDDEGYLGKIGYQLGYADSKKTHTSHPNTGVVFEGYDIAYTEQMITVAKKLHSHTPHLGIISWDLTVDKFDNIILLEGNYYGQSIWFPQIVHGKSIFGNNTEKMIKLSR